MKQLMMITVAILCFSQVINASTIPANTEINDRIEKRRWHHYELPLTSDQRKVTIQLTNLRRDADLYVRQNKKPSRWWGRWDCRPYKSRRQSEQCIVDNIGNNTLHISVYGAKSTKYSISIATQTKQPETVFLLLHGLNSAPDTWNTVVDDIFKGYCPTLAGDDRDLELADTRCYRYHFESRTDKANQLWENGDGSTFDQLGEEVGLAMISLEEITQPKSVIIIGHSRGGLAARAFLQALNQSKPYPVGLLTIGTPHQGSPFGLLKHWMDQQGHKRDSLFLSALHFVFSPSTEALTTVLGNNGLPKNDSRASAIMTLNQNVGALGHQIDVFGQITSSGLELGENAAGYLDLLHGSKVSFILPGNMKDMRDFMTKNLFLDDWKTGDGIVPYASQQFNLIPGFDTNGAALWHGKLTKVPHADATQFDFWDSSPNDGETGQVSLIKAVLIRMLYTEGFTPLD